MSDVKTLVLIRHAKSSWRDSSQDDFDRPLNERGMSDAPLMAKKLNHLSIGSIQLWYISSAQRTTETFKYFQSEFNVHSSQVLFEKELYHASFEKIQDFIKSTDDSIDGIAIVCHNPGITHFINRIPNVKLDNLPTSGIAVVKYRGAWQSFDINATELRHLIYPKMYA